MYGGGAQSKLRGGLSCGKLYVVNKIVKAVDGGGG